MRVFLVWPAGLSMILVVFLNTPTAFPGTVPALARGPEIRLDIRQKAVHVFDRLSFGPRPGDVEQLAAKGEVGIARWIQEQLDPGAISEPGLEKKIKTLKSYGMTIPELLGKYKDLQEIAKEAGIDQKAMRQDGDAQEELRKNLKAKLREKFNEEVLPVNIQNDLITEKLIRAVESKRQLQEVLTDFWFNHFNVDFRKGAVKWYIGPYEHDVIRKNLFGNFRALLKAVATSPAMLFYLDNHLSQAEIVGEGLPAGRGGRFKRFMIARLNKKGPNNGINENYARELLELHTLGVEGGYSQKDIRELARVLTGWSIEKPRKLGEFKFRALLHDRGEKDVLGVHFAAGGGVEEGDKILDFLAVQPATARHLATKLCRLFVSDHPPAALVERVARRFLATQGNLTETYREIFSSPEFWSREAYRAKIKTPLQYAVSSVRALGGEVDTDAALGRSVEQMGEPLYRCAPPTGYKDDAETWVNPGSLMNRMKFAAKLAGGKIDGVFVKLPVVQVKAPAGGTALLRNEIVKQLESRLLHEQLSPVSEKVVLSEFDGEESGATGTDYLMEGEIRPMILSKAVGLLLGSPEFQKR